MCSVLQDEVEGRMARANVTVDLIYCRRARDAMEDDLDLLKEARGWKEDEGPYIPHAWGVVSPQTLKERWLLLQMNMEF